MEASDIRNLQEAYLEVYEERDSSHPHWQTNRQFKKSEKKNQELISAAQKRREDRRRNRNPLFGPSEKMTKTQKEQTDLYDIILSHLLDEGYTNSIEGAEVILENMSEGWMESIMEAFVDPETGEAPSGRSPVENVSYHPKKSVRRKAMRAFAKQMSKEYGGKWKAKTEDPTKDD
jgi:hypothetical protein